MANQLTVTAKSGPAVQSTAIVLTNVTDIKYDFVRQVVYVTTNGLIKEFDLGGVTTLTLTLSAGNYTLVLS